MLYNSYMEQKYGVVVERKYHIEGDERSKTHPGHGYPAHTDIFKELITFIDKEALEAWLLKNYKSCNVLYAIGFCDLDFKITEKVELNI